MRAYARREALRSGSCVKGFSRLRGPKWMEGIGRMSLEQFALRRGRSDVHCVPVSGKSANSFAHMRNRAYNDCESDRPRNVRVFRSDNRRCAPRRNRMPEVKDGHEKRTCPVFCPLSTSVRRIRSHGRDHKHRGGNDTKEGTERWPLTERGDAYD